MLLFFCVNPNDDKTGFVCVCVCVCCREQDESAMVFVSSELGEHSITTRDIDVNENTIIQFEVNKRSLDDFFSKATMKIMIHLGC